MTLNPVSSATSPVFDLGRAILRNVPSDQPLKINPPQPLRQSLDNHEITEDTSLQVVEIHGKPYGFVTRELLLYDVAQGSTDGMEWLVTFCLICNAGALFSAKLDEQTYHFTAGGIYNAMAILRDQETGSYWDLINGTCLHGPSQGKQLQRINTLRHMSARNALVAFPTLEIAALPMTPADIESMEEEDAFRLAARPEWSSRIANTMTREDPRLPRFDMGLGIWTPTLARYYPVITMNAQDNFAFDTLEERNLIVYLDPDSRIPDAFFTDATDAHWQGEFLVLGNGQKIHHGAVFDAAGDLVKVQRPLQLFQRWYGFAVMFQACEIYAAPAAR